MTGTEELATVGESVDGMAEVDRAEAIELLAGVPFLAMMPGETRASLASSLSAFRVPFGSVVVRQGDVQGAFYVIRSGRARVLTEGEHGDEVSLATLGRGDSFGEGMLLGEQTRSHTVRASSDLELLRLDLEVLRDLLAADPEMREAMELQARHRALENFLRLNSRLAELPHDTVVAMLHALVRMDTMAGDVVVREGDAGGSMYIVEAGKLFAYTGQGAEREILAYFRAGDVFGERALFTHSPRFATVEAVAECRLLRLPEGAFASLMADHAPFRDLVETMVAAYDYKRTANVPLDFADEILPADAAPMPVASDDSAEAGTTKLSAPSGVADGLLAPSTAAESEGETVTKIRRFPVVRQVDEADCGAAALSAVCKHFGRSVSIGRVRQAVRTGIDGTSLRGLVSGAEELGFDTKAMKVSATNLDRIPLPAIVHWDGNHWFSLYRVDDDEVRVSDPGAGIRKIPRDEFVKRWSGFALLLQPTDRLDELPAKRRKYAWLWPLVRPYWKTFAFAAFLGLVVAAVSLVVPIFTAIIVDSVLGPKDLSLLYALIGGLAAATLAMAGATLLQRYILGKTAVKVDGSTLDHLTAKLLALPMKYFYTRRVGDIQRRLVGLRQAREFAVANGVRATAAIAQLIAGVALMLIYSPILTLAFFAIAPVYVLLVRFAIKRMKPMTDNLEDSFGRYASRQIDAIKGMETVKAMGAEDYLRADLVKSFNGLAQRQFRVDFASMAYDGAVQILSFISFGIFLWIGSLQVVNGALSVGEFVSFNALVALCGASIIILMAIFDEMQYASVLIDRLEDIFEEEPEQGSDHSALRTVGSLEGRVTLDRLSFRYAPDSPPVLEEISIDVPAGTTVAVVGRSGSGKSTLLKLLAGLIEPTEGSVAYDGVPLPELDHASLRTHVGFVLQDSYLFSDTIANNIAFGAETVDPERVEWASRMASAHEFVARFPLGYETRIGETGLLLSGGQRQRVCIARALYHKPPVLLLDEATSALDSESERAVRDNMDELLGDRTAFVIAHRMATVRDADLILVMDRGRIVERGTHDELLARRGLYFFLAGEQMGE